METLIAFFENLSTPYKAVWIIACLTLFWTAEGIIPLRHFTYKKWKHAKVNFAFLGFTMLINVIFGLLTLGVFTWLSQTQFGLLYAVVLPLWVELLLGIMLLDFIAQYVAHVLLHKVSPLWRLHMVHHSDTHVDVTTGTRHHPLDFIFRELMSLVAVIIGGLPLAFYVIYRILTIFFTYLIHANWQLPEALDKAVSFVFISPNMHKFHHHFERPWTDTNYGNIFSLWDRMFGTFVYADMDAIHYGLDTVDDKYSDDLTYQLKLPFDKSVETDY